MIDTDPALFDGGRRLPLVEDFYTIQGEGFHAGKPAYFIRLTWAVAGATPNIRGIPAATRPSTCRWSSTVR